MPTAVDQTATTPRTRDPGEQHTVTRKNVCYRQKTATHVSRLMHPSQTRETAFNKDEGKHGQREILERRDIRQVPNKRRVEVQSQNRDLLMKDVCTCLACTKTFPRSLTDLTNISRKRLILQQSVERH